MRKSVARRSKRVRSSRQSSRRQSSRRQSSRRQSLRRQSARRSRRSRNRRVVGGKRSRTRRYRRRMMRGGDYPLQYSPLPCNEDGTTNFDSTQQVGHETCVEYGTEGAENDARAAGLGAGRLADMDIRDSIKDAVDAELARRMAAGEIPTTQAINVAGASNEAAARAAAIAAGEITGQVFGTGAPTTQAPPPTTTVA